MTATIGRTLLGSVHALVRPIRSSRLDAIAGGLAVAGWLIAFLNVAVSVGVWLSRGAPVLPISYAPGPLAVAGISVCALAYATVGAILAQRLRGNPIGWLLLLVGLIVSAVVPVALVVDDALGVVRAAPAPLLLVAWLVSAITAPAALASVTIAVLLFPDGRRVSAAWYHGPRPAIAGAAALILGTAVGPMQLWYPALPGPALLRGVPQVVGPMLQVGGMLLLLTATLAAATVLVTRFRAADAVLRSQIRWVVVAGLTLLVTVTPLYLGRYSARVPDDVGERLLILCTFGASVFPLAVGVAMVRHHLYELDTFLTRTLVRVALTAVLAGLTAATVTLFQRVFIVLTDDTSDMAIVFTTLVLASAFTPVMSALDGYVARVFGADDGSKERDGTVAGRGPDPHSAPRPEPSSPDALEELRQRVALLESRLASSSQAREPSPSAPRDIPHRGVTAAADPPRHPSGTHRYAGRPGLAAPAGTRDGVWTTGGTPIRRARTPRRRRAL